MTRLYCLLFIRISTPFLGTLRVCCSLFLQKDSTEQPELQYDEFGFRVDAEGKSLPPMVAFLKVRKVFMVEFVVFHCRVPANG